MHAQLLHLLFKNIALLHVKFNEIFIDWFTSIFLSISDFQPIMLQSQEVDYATKDPNSDFIEESIFQNEKTFQLK
jgi:hypothetical protein